MSPSGATFHLYSAVFYSQKVINKYIFNALSTATETRAVGFCSRGETFAQAPPEQNVIGKVVLVMKPCGFILFRFFSPSIYLSLCVLPIQQALMLRFLHTMMIRKGCEARRDKTNRFNRRTC